MQSWFTRSVVGSVFAVVTCLSCGWIGAQAVGAAPSADLRLEATGGTPVRVGEYTEVGARVSVAAGSVSEDVTAAVTLPPGLTLDRVSLDNAVPLSTCAPTALARQTACDLGTITITTAAHFIYVTVTASRSAVVGTEKPVTISVTGSTADPDLSNNMVSDPVLIEPTANLVPSISPLDLVRGRVNSVAVRVRNDGPDPARRLVVNIYLTSADYGFQWDQSNFASRYIKGFGYSIQWMPPGVLLPGHTAVLNVRLDVAATATSAIFTVGPDTFAADNPLCTANRCGITVKLTSHAAASDAVGGLANTGTPVGGMVIFALAMVALGAALAITAPRRRPLV